MSLSLDIQTIVILLLVSTVLMVLVLAIGSRSGTRDGHRSWIAGLALIALAWFLIALRDVVGPIITVALADSVLLAGLVMLVAACFEFGGKQIPSIFLLLPPILFVVLLPVRDQFAVYTFIAGAMLSTALLALGVSIWKFGHGSVRWPLTMLLVASAGLVVYRSVFVFELEPSNTKLVEFDPLNGGTFVAIFVMTIIASLGFLQMQKERAEEKLMHLAMHDGLTELLNRRAFFELADRELTIARREDKPIAVLLFDIDYFKRINDTLGHDQGDAVLREIASRIKSTIRRSDLFGRIGGEEFCVLLTNLENEEPRRLAERTRRAIGDSPFANVPWPVTISIGISFYDAESDDTIAATINRADKALYRAKNEGRNRVAIHTPNINSPDESRSH